MIYTCYEMIRDCREGRDEGWRYFVSHYVPVVRRIVTQYSPANAGDRFIESVFKTLRGPESSLFQNHDPAPERWFVAELRQLVLAALDRLATTEAESTLNLSLLTEALEPLTVVEKQAVWLETMRYGANEAATLLRMEGRTVAKIRERAAELLRSKLDTWRRTVLADEGRSLGRLAAAEGTAECPAAKQFLDVLDGRSSWSQREELERHAGPCWHCIDHFCRMAEVIEFVRAIEPLGEPEAEAFRAVLGIPPAKKTLWKRWTASR